MTGEVARRLSGAREVYVHTGARRGKGPSCGGGRKCVPDEGQ